MEMWPRLAVRAKIVTRHLFLFERHCWHGQPGQAIAATHIRKTLADGTQVTIKGDASHGA
jgi:hypothetical protein